MISSPFSSLPVIESSEIAMDSKILSQALFTIPRNHKQCLPKTIGFCNFVAGHSIVSSSCCRVSFSRVSASSIGHNLVHSYALPRKRDFVTKAEANSGAEVEVETGEASVSVVEATSELEDAKLPRKPRVKLGDVMGILNKRAVDASENERPVPDVRTGDIVEIKLEVPENRRRLSIYKGIVISRQNAGIHTTIRIRRIIAGVGVEIVFPLYSPNVKELKVVNHRKVRRARLYYLRDKLPRLSTFK